MAKDQKDGKFSEAEMANFKKEFDSFDQNGDGHIDAKEVQQVLKNLKMFKSEDQVKQLIKEVDKNNNGTVEYVEFLDIVLNVKEGRESAFTQVYTKQRDLIQIKTASGGTHSFAEEEMSAFAEHINNCLAPDAECKYLLPIDPTGVDLCKKVKDGILLSKFINLAVKDTIDERALNKRKNNKELNVHQMNENQTLCINAAKGIGVKITNIGATELMNGEKFPHIVLGVVWQLVKIHLLNSINLKNHPELVRLLEAGEELADLLKLPPDQLLLRWFNYHLKRANHKKISNFTSDIKDSDAYTTLLHQIAPNTCDTAALGMSDMSARAGKVLANATKLNVKCFIKPRDIVSANGKLNLIFTAAIFNQCPGLDPLTAEETKKAGLMDDDSGDSREERMFRMWINSLGIDDLHVNSLFQDCRDGLVLLKVLDKVEPGIVSWSKVEKNPNNKFKKIANCNYAVVLGKQLKFSLVGIQGGDIEDAKNPKLLLAFVWQLMRYHTFKFLAEVQKKKFGGKAVGEAEVMEWANKLVKTSGKNKDTEMKSLGDSALGTGLFFLDLLHAINQGIVDWEVVTKGDTKENAILNCRYVISVARKLGATIFCLPEDINESKPKMITTLLASCMAISPV